MKKYIIVAILAVLTLNSCKDFLVQEPIMSQSTELTLSDYNGLNKAIAGAYGPIADGSWYGAFYVLNSEMRVGNAMIPTVSDFTSGRMTVPYNMNYDASSTEGLWSLAYYVISAANNVLDKLVGNEESFVSSSVSIEDIDNLEAEAMAIRALAHFDCLRLYARTDGKTNQELGIPLILTPQLPTDMPARNTVAECFDQIIADLTKAEELMADDYVRDGIADEHAVITKPVIWALLSRVNLYAQKYQAAADYATKVIDCGLYNLWTAEEYTSVWGEDVAEDGGEVIFEIYGKQANDYDEYWEGPSHMTNPLGYADCAASADLVGLFEEGDVRGTCGVRGTDDGKAMFCTDKDQVSGGQMWTMKYFGKGEGNATSTPDVSNVIVLRLSEMYLIRAEAIANGASVAGTSAVKDVNAIRANRGASTLGAAGVDTIIKERRLELNFEGSYWFDLARTGGSFTYKDAAITKEVPSDSKYWALPIPKSQIDLDKELVQNPGYDN